MAQSAPAHGVVSVPFTPLAWKSASTPNTIGPVCQL